MSIVSSARSVPQTVLCQVEGTRPRLANNSSTRGITPGSACAWTEKQAVAEGSSSATVARRGGMSLVLGRKAANRASPNPQRVRDHNSPADPAVDVQTSHSVRFRAVGRLGQLAFRLVCCPDRKLPLLRS